MVRVKRGTTSLKTRKNVLKRVKGYIFGRSKKERQAYEAISHAGASAFAHRRKKKGDFRKLWTVKLNAALRPLGFSYSVFIDTITKKGITLNRKVLSEIAHEEPEAFARIVESVK